MKAKAKKRFRKVLYFLLGNIGMPLAWLLFELWRRSLRIEYIHLDSVEGNLKQGQGAVYSFWHGDLFLIACGGIVQNKINPIHIMTSRSRDGEMLSRFLHKLGFGTVRGSSSRGGTGALLILNRILKEGRPTAIAVDGPRGPRCQAKSGAILLARTSGSIIFPVAAASSKTIRLRSWDRCEIPLPFSRCRVSVGSPISVTHDADREKIEEVRTSLQEKLNQLKMSIQL